MTAVGYKKGWFVYVKPQGNGLEARKNGETVVLESSTIEGLEELINMREGKGGWCERKANDE